MSATRRTTLMIALWVFIMLTLPASAYEDADQSYFPVLTPPSHLYVVSTWNDGAGNEIAGMESSLGDLSPATTFEFDIYIVSCDEPATDTDIRFVFYEDPFYSGHAEYTYDMGVAPVGSWIHVSTPVASIPNSGLDWSKGGILQIKGATGAFDIYLDNAGFFTAGGATVRIMVDGANDTWGHTFDTAPEHADPPVPNAGPATRVVYGAGTQDYGNVSNATKYVKQMIMLESIQGLLLKQGHTAGLYIDTSSYYRNNLTQLLARRSVTSEYVAAPSTPWTVVDQFKTDLGSKYVKFDLEGNPDSLNAARMAAHLHNAIMIEDELEAQALAHGLILALDVSSYDDQWIYNNWWGTWHRKDMIVDSFTAGNYAAMMNEYAVAYGSASCREPGGTALRFAFLDDMDIDSPVLGWPTEDYGELPSTLDNSEHDTFNVCVNASHNTALTSSFRNAAQYPIEQPNHSSITVQPNVHYVTFVWSDGDNLSWQNVGYSWDSRWWGSPSRGALPIAWPISPACRDMGAINLEYRYDTATANDQFIAVGPTGYAYPGHFSAQARATSAERLGDQMADLDLSVVLFLDRDAFEWPHVYEPYLIEPQIDGIFYWDVWGDYAKYQGDITFVNNKPIVSCYKMLSGNPAEVAAAVNARPTNGRMETGYSMIGVSAWSSSTAEIVQCANLFNANVRVVSPEEFIQLIQDNLASGVSQDGPLYNIDLGDSQLAAYGTPTDPSFTIATSNTEQQIDGTPSTKIQLGPAYAFSNMHFSAIDLTAATSLEADIHGDGSGTVIRLEFYSQHYGSFLYKDVVLDFNGWRGHSWNLDGSDDGMLHWGPASREQTISSVSIWQVSGSWNSSSATFYLDNVRVMGANPLDLVPDGTIDELDWLRFFDYWLTDAVVADFNGDGSIDLEDWGWYPRQRAQ